MEPKRVIVTYCDEHGNWANIADDLASRLPLRNLVWKPSNNRATRNIAMLDVELRRFAPESSKNLPPVTLLQNPYLNLYFVNCEDNETYKTTVRQQIREWIQLVTSKKNQEWLIVHVSNQEGARNATRFLKSSVLDRIKADFNTGKKDRVAQLKMADTELSEMELWADFTAKMKDGIVSSFDQNVLTFEEDIRRLDSQRQMPGWNYCTFFILKEGLTHAYEMMNLHEEALRQYDELEASFFQILRDNALTWYGKFGGMQEGDDDANLLDINRKPYRDLIMQNTISVFDFRTYLFGRQCNLLFRLRRPVEICHRALIFIPAFARTVREHVSNLTENFLESWIYSACMCIVNECDDTVPMSSDDPHMMVLLDGAKAELLQLARQQLDRLGIQHGRLPEELPFTMSVGFEDNNDQAHSEEVERKPMSKDLLEAVSTNETFDALYMSVSARAIKGFDGSGRHRSSLLLHGDVAALQFFRKKYAEAARILESITWRYGHNGWTVLENELVIKHAKCLRELGDTNKYAQACLTLLRNMNDLNQEDQLFYANELFGTAGSKDLKQELYHQFAPMFDIKVVSVVDILKDEDGSYLDIIIDNKLPKEIEFNKLSLRMVSGEVDELWFNIRHGTLKPGKNPLRVTCETSASGTYVLEKVHLKVGKLVFLYDFLQENKKRVFRVDSNPQALKASIKSPSVREAGHSNTFLVYVSSGKNHVAEATLSLFPASEGISLSLVPALTFTKESADGSGKVAAPGEISLENYDAVTLPAFGPNETLIIAVPYESMMELHEHFLKLVIQYLAPNARRHAFTLTTSIDTLLPLQVSHSVIWRDQSLNLKVDVTCTGLVPVRIMNVELRQPKSVKEFNQPPFVGETTLFPRQHASFVFKISRPADVQDLVSKTDFIISYQSLKEEVESALSAVINADLAKAELSQHALFVTAHLKNLLLKSVDYTAYGMSDELELPALDVRSCESAFAYHDAKVRNVLIGILKDLFSDKKRLDYDQIVELSSSNQVRQISFPIALPTTQMLVTVEITAEGQQELTVGTPATFQLSVQHSSYWNAIQEEEKSSDFYYDILVDYENWLLCGHKKRLFSAKPGTITTHAVSLVPLKTGPLHVPKIVITSGASSVYCQTAYVNEAEQVLIKPRTTTSTFFIDQQRGVHFTNSQVGR
ncbi:trafficking protein particle complex subunit 10 [Entomortierella parvispora]|uniref:Trafficking protein particle complex subunit 10 n=1 Tax=Entomortierella parvispora TaxID=205924 RepID=A0A9P3HAI8_9FUNG|nr:trafficking protein particle complex subunit 10 [Entomortierella parvispora]